MATENQNPFDHLDAVAQFYEESTGGCTWELAQRTLKPGGVAVVTNWEELGYMPVTRTLQREIRPDNEPFNVPIKPEWFEPTHAEQDLKSAGFQKVELQTKIVHWGAGSLEEVSSSILQMFGPAVFKDWSDEDKKRAINMVP